MNKETQAVLFSSEKRDWGTPTPFYNGLDAEFHFTIDVCASQGNAKHSRYWTEEDDFFKQTLGEGEVGFMNPPYGKAEHPCESNCTKKRCKGGGHKPDCPPDCTNTKCIGRGYCVTTYQPGINDFMAHALKLSLGGATMVCLVPARVDTEWWQDQVHGKADEVRFIDGRLAFEDGEGNEDSAPFPTAIVVYRPPLQRRHTHMTRMRGR